MNKQKWFTTFMETERGFAPILIVVLVAVLGIGGYFMYTNYSNNQTSIKVVPATPTDSTFDEITPNETANPDLIGAKWKTYTHSGFTFKYPEKWYPENNPNYPGGNNVSFFLAGTKADHGYGDHKGNEVFSFEFSNDDRSLEELKREYYQNAVDLMVDYKPAIKTSFNLLIVKPSQNKKLNIIGGIEAAKPYLDQILSTFRFE